MAFGTLLRTLARLADVDRAVALTLALRVWQACAGAVTLLLVARFFSPELQGYYYAFASMLALQVYVELGLYNVVMVLASHAWSKLKTDAAHRVIGDAVSLSRLASLARFIAQWYSVAGGLFVLVIGAAGHAFFALSDDGKLPWVGAWWTVVALTGLQLWLMPFLSLLEGCNQIVTLTRFRLVQAIAEAIVVWLLLAAGFGLWVMAASIATKVVTASAFLLVRYGNFMLSLGRARRSAMIDWRTEVWPMQWRIAAQATTNYLAYSLFTPVMFHFHGATLAGQMGMTLQVLGVVQIMAGAWMQARNPRFGMLAAKRDYPELDRVWSRASTSTVVFTVAASAALLALLLLLRHFDHSFTQRLLPPAAIALFALGYVFSQIGGNRAVYLRAHGKEPFLMLGVTSGLLNGVLTVALGSQYGAYGAALAFLATAACFTLPVSGIIWRRRKSEWQAT